MLGLTLAPDRAIGWTHVWDGAEQLAISDEIATVMVMAGMIEYSPEDGPNARVYRPLGGRTCADLRKMLT